MTGRRSFLGKVGATGVAVAAGIAILPSPPKSAATVRSADDRDGENRTVPWEGPITDEDATPIARYQYRAAGDGFEPTSPINVVFPLADAEEGLEDVAAVLEDAGWSRPPEEYARYAWDRRTEEYVLQEATAAETYFGTHGRLHVRCWEFEGVVSMQTHEDSRPWPRHAIDSYERARTVIESLFDAEGWTRYAARIDLANGKSPDHDGHATVIGA